MDLEKELTCSICTELLYQPLTLIDCLHTFCGSCLQHWFAFQALAFENAPTPPEPGTPVYTCPSCRAAVRDTRHNATVGNLVDMVLEAHPEKGRSAEDKEEIATKYKPGDQVLRKLNIPEKTAEDLAAEEADRRLIAEVRQISLSEVGVGGGSSHASRPPRTRRRGETRSADGRGTSSREASRDRRSGGRREGSRPRRSQDQRHNSDLLLPEGRSSGGRRNRDASRRSAEEEWSDSSARRRQIEHQSSLRSLISSHEMSERDFEREIEEFARQIQEEGLLDGLDLDNIDLSQNDELSRKITEAYRRRHRERSRQENGRRSNASAVSRHSEQPPTPSPAESTTRLAETSRPTSRQRPHSRSASAASAVSQSDERPGRSEDRSRPPISNASSHLDVDDPRRRRRAASSGRSATTPAPPASEVRVRTRRSQTDITVRTQEMDTLASRPVMGEGRSATSPVVTTSSALQQLQLAELPATADHSPTRRVFSETSNAATSSPSPISTPTMAELPVPRNQMQRPTRPADLAILSSATTNPLGSPTSPGQQRPRSQLFQEPSINCSSCSKPHIEYELHYNCAVCSGGNWNLCLDCYRSRKGCQHWFGFGHGAWTRWEREKVAKKDPNLPRPHIMTANRYQPPRVAPGGADGRRTLTTDDPLKRLESGNFCARCYSWANDCYWRCDVCNEGDWGFCNACTTQGRCCTHPLLPLTYVPPSPSSSSFSTPPASPRLPVLPHSAAILTGPGVASIGPFKPLGFYPRCEVCHDAITFTQPRYHCFSCASSVEPDARPGEYDICSTCYSSLVSKKQISPENGPNGWRRCLAGHRMVVLAFQESRGGSLRRVVQRDLVGGRNMRFQPYELVGPEHRGSSFHGLQKLTWQEGERKFERLVMVDVAGRAPTSDGPTVFAQTFPPDGGVGPVANATWSWYPKVEDELLFPKGAEIREIDDVNGHWFFGVYMGALGVFPASYVRMASNGTTSQGA